MNLARVSFNDTRVLADNGKDTIRLMYKRSPFGTVRPVLLPVFTVILGILFLTGLVSGQEISSPSLKLSELVKAVLAGNPNLAAARNRVQAARHAVIRSQALDDPQLSVMSEDTPFKSESELMPMVVYELSQMLPFPGKRDLRGRIAGESVKSADSEQALTVNNLIFETKRRYYQLYLNKVARRINEANQELLKRLAEAALVRYRAGQGEYAEVLKMQTELQMLQNELLTLRRERVSLVAMINALLNRPPAGLLGEPVEELSPPRNFDYDYLFGAAVEHRPELKRMKAMIREQEHMADLARLEYYPDFMVSGKYQAITEGGDDAWGAGIAINLPVWIRSKQKQEIFQAKARAAAVRNELEGMVAMIQSEIQDILAGIETTEQQLDLYQTSLIPLTVQALSAAETRYRTGMGDFVLLLDTRRQLQLLELEYERMRVERELQLAELERAVGGAIADFGFRNAE